MKNLNNHKNKTIKLIHDKYDIGVFYDEIEIDKTKILNNLPI